MLQGGRDVAIGTIQISSKYSFDHFISSCSVRLSYANRFMNMISQPRMFINWLSEVEDLTDRGDLATSTACPTYRIAGIPMRWYYYCDTP